LDDPLFDRNMVEHIHNEIDRADLTSPAMSTKNPNVFYEVRYDAKKKLIIFLRATRATSPSTWSSDRTLCTSASQRCR
jgi:hypothetical protein